MVLFWSHPIIIVKMIQVLQIFIEPVSKLSKIFLYHIGYLDPLRINSNRMGISPSFIICYRCLWITTLQRIDLLLLFIIRCRCRRKDTGTSDLNQCKAFYWFFVSTCRWNNLLMLENDLYRKEFWLKQHCTSMPSKCWTRFAPSFVLYGRIEPLFDFDQ